MRKNINIILKAIEDAQKKNKKASKKIKIIAATKKQPIEKIKEAQKRGITIIGENRIQEAEEKFKSIDEKIEKHFIGHLQTNKTKKAVQLFDIIQTADSNKIIKKINEEAKKIQKTQKIMLQINTGRDKKKYGFLPEEIKNIKIETYKNIEIIGVMTIAPQKKTKKELRQIFKNTKNIQEKIKKKIKECEELSMGMTDDYVEGIAEGATYIRIGTGIFGKRK